MSTSLSSAGRPLDELLAAYAAGTLPAPLQSLVAAHLELRPENRAFVAALEDLGGAAIEDMPPLEFSRRDACLSAIFEGAARPPCELAPPACSVVPPALARYLGRPFGQVPWRKRLPGIREFHVDAAEGAEATLYWIAAGRAIPSHTHEGSEITLVLKGSFADASGHYGRGDIAIADSEVDHRPRAGEGEDCICFAVTDAPLRLTGPVGRIVQRLLRH
ncbi:ChrR family anti-sigma-E factor [Alsobacter sp. SYSU M60028]|uniref:ChrR family anti-sigma-E factor n=1 Tax=Alsobacter ponti TaxID=2962936 RepID=A0ABT1LEK7_9HYPH|nr:ChrR family anti-sigma-E factor [Alsobacter ponti]